MESQPQNPEFRNNSKNFPENFHPCEWPKEPNPSKCDCISPKVKHLEIVIPGKISVQQSNRQNFKLLCSVHAISFINYTIANKYYVSISINLNLNL